MASWKRHRRYLDGDGRGTIIAPPGSTFATWDPNPLVLWYGTVPGPNAGLSFSNGNLTVTRTSGSGGHVKSTIGCWSENTPTTRKKSYCELTIGNPFDTANSSGVGLVNQESAGDTGGLNGIHYNSVNGHTYAFFWDFAYSIAFGAGKVIGIAMDWGNPPINGGNATAFSINGAWGNGDNPTNRILTAYDDLRAITHTVFVGAAPNNIGDSVTANFGATPFVYPVPAGFRPGLYT